MADIRINSLPSTATSFNTDDYIAIDGASGGTRKMLAATLPLTDVTLGGSSGPSVKSTLSARAPRQGLVFDSSAHGGAPIANQPAFGTSDFTVTAWVNPVSVASNTYILSSVSDSASLFFAANTVQWIANASAVISVAGGVVAGKSQLFVVTRNAGTTTYYYNGVAVSTTPSGSGNLANPIVKMGSSASGASGHFNGTISALIYNRALSASEVVALYEAGAPAGADYPATVAGTDIVTSGNFSSATGWAVGSAWSISGGVATTNGTADGGGSTELAQTGKSFKAGQRIRVKFTLGNVSAGGFRIIFYGGSANTLTTIRTASGTYTEEVVLAGSATAFQTIASISGVSLNNGATLDDLSIVPLGLLLAPDAAQAGGGLVWYDTSGNAANITLPASGVSWNVPFAGYVTAPTTTNLTLNGGSSGASLVLAQGSSDATALTANVSLYLQKAAASAIVFRNNAAGSYTEAMRIAGTTGNLLIGTTTDGGQKLQVSGTARVSGVTTVGGGSNDLLKFEADTAGNGGYLMGRNAADTDYTPLILIGNGLTLKYRTGVNSSANALAIDSSANATFAGSTISLAPSANDALFNVKGRATGTNQAASTSRGASLLVTNLNNTDNNCEALSFQNSNELAIASVVAQNVSHTGRTGKLYFNISNGAAPAEALNIAADKTATFAGAIAIGNTVQTAAGVSSTHKVTISIGGSTYYLLATNV